MKKTDEQILRKISVPRKLPIHMDAATYKQQKLTEIRSYMAKGMSFNKALAKATGAPYKSGSHRKHQSRIAVGGKIVLAATILSATILGVTSFVLHEKNYIPQNVSAVAEETKTGTQQQEMILVAGLDTRPEVDQGYGTSNDVDGSRTDVLALVSIPEDGSRATIVSIPRDTSVDRGQCQAYDLDTQEYTQQYVPAEHNVKVNSLYGVGGPRCLVNTLNESFDISINRYIEMDFEAFQSVVDAIGGVEIVADAPVIDDVLGAIIPEPGTHTLLGKQALDYVRARSVQGTVKNDFDRIQRQQQFFVSLMNKLLDSGNMNNPAFLTKMASAILPNMRKDNANMDDLLKIGYSLAEMNKDAIRLTTLPIAGEDQFGNLIVDKNAAFALFHTLNTNKPFVGDAQTDTQGVQVKTQSLQKTPILLVTKTKFDERAAELRTTLQELGADVSIVESNKIPDVSTVFYDTENVAYAATLGTVFPYVTISDVVPPVDKISRSTVVISIGQDYQKALQNPQDAEVGKTIHIPNNFTGEASLVIPQDIPAMMEYPNHSVGEASTK